MGKDAKIRKERAAAATAAVKIELVDVVRLQVLAAKRDAIAARREALDAQERELVQVGAAIMAKYKIPPGQFTVADDGTLKPVPTDPPPAQAPVEKPPGS